MGPEIIVDFPSYVAFATLYAEPRSKEMWLYYLKKAREEEASLREDILHEFHKVEPSYVNLRFTIDRLITVSHFVGELAEEIANRTKREDWQ